MSGQEQLFSANLATNALYKTGLRSFMEYRDLGIEQATHGQFRARVVRIKKESAGNHDLHTTGLYSPAVHETVVVGRVPEAAAAR